MRSTTLYKVKRWYLQGYKLKWIWLISFTRSVCLPIFGKSFTYERLPISFNFQIVQSSAEVFEDDILPTAGFSGTVQYVSEKPSFGVEVSGLNRDQKPRKRDNQNLSNIFNKGKNEEEGEEEDDEEEAEDGNAASTGSRLQLGQSQKETAKNDLRNRLKNRFQKFKAKVNAEDQARYCQKIFTKLSFLR